MTNREQASEDNQKRRPRIGIFGGTFDPIHIGHLVAAENAQFACKLDRVIFMVAGDPWHKSSHHDVTPADKRLGAVQAAIAGHLDFEVSRMEIDRPGATYTADTLETISRENPDCELFLLMGFDAAATLETWDRAEVIAELATVVIIRRPGNPKIELSDRWKSHQVHMPALEISSTDLRRRLLENEPWHYLIPDNAAALIAEGWGYHGDK